ncbi:VCBS domain-containing protein [Gimesia aquarii]|uniref:NPCBM-associated, NEW3 domain of alpha-galactosidase n=1 Tax=Gimesia aquarii TaxID=2527964 RepID=A0A517WYB5_9PLAN|nr:VCBS domain-containing protein [Gimesia aquarii]QDU10247.1 NPCBM-associated, NEW3 domain of alpha-galactosidase [Gimesia aquarii]
MKSLKRLFGRKTARKVNRRLPFRVSRPIGYASHVERLEDRTLLASNILASLESSVNQPNDTTELTLNVGPGSSPTLGFEVRAAANSVFDPAAIRIFDANTNAVIPLELAENDHNGSTNSLALANLGPGEYRIEVTGQTSDTGGFVIDVFLPGDSDGSGSVSDTEYQHALAAMQQHLFGFNSVTAHLIVQQMGLDPSTNFYSEELDSDRDGDVDNDDLSLMTANRNIPAVQFELIGDQDPPQIIAGLQIDSGVSNSDGITNDLTILGNISDESLITQFKVGLDGAPLVDFVDIFSLISGGANGGSFTLTRSWIETNLNNGNSLEGGTHTLSFFAQDEHDNNNVDSFFDVTFELDVTDPTATGTPITNQNEDEDFGSLDLGPLTDFFNQNGGTALSFQVDSITNPIVTVDFSSGNLVLNSIQDAFGSTDIVILAMDLAGNSVLSNLFTVDVNPQNDAPVAIDDAFTTDEDTVLNGGTNVFAANPTTPDSDVENDPFTVTEVNGNAASVGNQITLTSGALLTLNSNGTFTYNPNGAFDNLADGQSDTDSFTYTIDDGTGSLITTDTATVTVTINGLNDDASIGGDNAGDMTEDEAGDSGTLTITDVDDGEDVFVTQSSTVGTHGTFSIDAAGNWTYTRTADLNALNAGDQVTDTFTVTSSDGTATEDVTITINGLNDDASIGGDNAGDMTEDEAGDSGTLTITDVDDGEDVFVTQSSTVGTHGTFSIDAAGNWTYTRTADLNALNAGDQVTDTFTVTSSDGTATEDVTITINGLNDDASIGGDNAGDMTEDEAGDSGTLTITDVDDGEDVFVTQSSTVGTHGTFSIDAAGNWTYTRTADLNALNAGDQVTDTFTVTSSDGTATEDVTITINGLNDPPVAEADAFTTDEDTSTGGDLFADNGSGVDSDPDSSASFTITEVNGVSGNVNSPIILASGATLTVNTDGTFTYDPSSSSQFNALAAGAQDTDSFAYTIDDGLSGTDTATVTITINGVNDPPVAEADAFTTDEDTSTGGDLFADNGSGVDSDPDNGASFTITEVNGVSGDVNNPIILGSGATLTVNANGTFTYDPSSSSQFNALADGEQDTDSFTYTIDDGLSGTDVATVTITINGVNDPVTAQDDAVTTSKNNTINIDVTADNGNGPDTDPDTNDILSVTHIADSSITTTPIITNVPFQLTSGALLTLNVDGTLTYDPNGQFNGLTLPTDTAEDTFTYTIDDGNGSTNTAIVTVTVTGSNELLMVVGAGLPDIERDGLTSEVINLDNFFNDADAGDTISYQVGATLVGGDPLPANFWANNISIENGNELHIDYSIFSDAQVRLPVEITVTATSSDTVSPDVSSTFTLTPDPQITAEVRLLTRSTASSGRDFVFFRAEAPLGPIPGAAQLQLTNNLQDLDFTIFLKDYVDLGTLDFDGTATPSDSTDDLGVVTIVDTTTFSTVFTIYNSALSNDGIVKDDAAFTLSGTWEGLSSEMVDKLYNGDLAVRLQTQGGSTSTVAGENISASPEAANVNLLPTTQTEFVNGENYVVEIWVSDQLAQSLAAQSGLESGIGGLQVDLEWDGNTVSELLAVFVSGEATAFGSTSGVTSTNGVTGVISNINAATFVPGIAKDGGYARLGYALFRANSIVTDADPAEFTISMTPGPNVDDDAISRSSSIDFSQISLVGASVTHVQAPAAPLHGTNGQDQGTSVDLIVVQEQTEIDSTGHAVALPKSDAWVDEWSSFWVEIYMETPDARAIAEALVDLNYNTEFFTATEIEFGSAFADNGNALIDDSTGIVTSLHATATFEGAGSQRTALLARVKFESLEQDDVTIDFEDKFIGPHDLGLSLSNVQVALTDGFHTYLTDDIIVGDSPETDLWAIAYDVNDDDAINFRDLMILASIYGDNVLDTNSPYVWALDADKSGTVNFKDLSFFATNYGVYKGGNQQVAYPPNFLQRWYGNTTDITGSSSINEVMDEALEIWQDALGLEQPLDIQLVITDLGGTQLGEGQITAVDEEGRPIAGIVTLDDDAAGLGWYSDINTTAFGGTELEGGVAHTADGNSDAVGRYDLLTVLLHEIGHVAGFTQTYAPFGSHVEVGVGGTLSFVGSGFEATLTNDGLHLDDTVHAGDIMNATLDPGVRKLPSVLDTLILQTAHETAANGNFEIQVGVNAPLMANLPTTELLATNTAMNQESAPVITGVESLIDLEIGTIQISSGLSGQNSPVLTQFNLASNHLNLNVSGLNQGELDLTVLEDFSEELVSDLRQNGLAIVGSGETNTALDSDSDETELNLFGLNERVEAGFDDVFSDWSGPIL